MSAPAVPSYLDTLDRLINEQEKLFLARTEGSQRLKAECSDVLPGGVTSSWQDAPPGTVWIDHGAGSRVVDIDGNSYVDLHGGFGVNLVGHAHPAIVAAVSDQVRKGTHFAQRVAAGRPVVVKVEGTYHGHHDSVQVSVYPSPDDIGPAARPNTVPVGTAVPRAMTDLTVVVPFGDLAAVERLLAEYPDQVAGMIVEPVMMNIGLIPAPPGYLAGLRSLLHRHGAYLAFDEVKTGFGIAAGGAVEWSGVTPDLICLAKALGGGLPCGAIGGTRELMALVADGTYEQVGTFNGNPLTMAAARAVVTEILTDDAYRHFDRLRHIMVSGARSVLARYGLPGYVQAFGAKGAVILHAQLRNYRDFLGYPDQWGNAHWIYQHNGGVFLPPWGKCEQWTVSVQHSDEDARRFVTNLETMAAALTNQSTVEDL